MRASDCTAVAAMEDASMTIALPTFVRTPLMAAALALAIGLPAAAQQPPAPGTPPAAAPSASSIVDALKAKGATRSVKTRGIGTPGAAAPAPNPEQARMIEGLKAKSTRGLSVQERNDVAKIAKESPSIDLVIYFGFNSADISPQSLPTLKSLGEALNNPAFKGTTILLAGHTDAVGSADYNQQLSERRSRAVRDYLIKTLGVPESQLMAVGFGKEQPKNASNPNADENRRVQVVNLGG
jgi:outer membrane protein OmpA-like peptidoglycan-associated protein